MAGQQRINSCGPIRDRLLPVGLGSGALFRCIRCGGCAGKPEALTDVNQVILVQAVDRHEIHTAHLQPFGDLTRGVASLDRITPLGRLCRRHSQNQAQKSPIDPLADALGHLPESSLPLAAYRYTGSF